MSNFDHLKKLGEGFYGEVFLDGQTIIKKHKWEDMAKLEARHLTLLSNYVDFMHPPASLDGNILCLSFQQGGSYKYEENKTDSLKKDIALNLSILHENKQTSFDGWYLLKDDNHQDTKVAQNWPEHYLNWLTDLIEKLKNKDLHSMTYLDQLDTPKWAIEVLEKFAKIQPELFSPLKNDQPTLVHGDPSSENTIVDNGKFIGLIDPFESGFYHQELDMIYPFQYDLQVLDFYMQKNGALKGNWELRLAYMAFANHVYHHYLTNWWDETYMQSQAQVMKDLEK